MPEVIISASGPQYGLVVNSDGSINVGGITVSGLSTGSVVYIQEVSPTDALKFAYIGSFSYTSDDLTQEVRFIDTGSYVRDFTYSGGVITGIGSWY